LFFDAYLFLTLIFVVTHTHKKKTLKPPFLWTLKFFCKTTDRKKKMKHSYHQTNLYQHAHLLSFFCRFIHAARVQRCIVILHCFLSSHILLFSCLYVRVSIWSNHLCICKASITLIFSHLQTTTSKSLSQAQ